MWLLSTAKHKAIDQLRRQTLAGEKLLEAGESLAGEEEPLSIDSLRLIFTCCHPALAMEAQVALTLRTICGLETDAIARTFLVPTPTLQQRLVRAKAKIKQARIRRADLARKPPPRRRSAPTPGRGTEEGPPVPHEGDCGRSAFIAAAIRAAAHQGRGDG